MDGTNWNWNKFIWTPRLLPKIKLFLWRCAINNLPTGENLRKWGLQRNTLCSRCGEEETLEHILFHCDMAVAVWELCPWSVPLSSRSCTSFRDTLQSSFLKTNLPPPPPARLLTSFPGYAGDYGSTETSTLLRTNRTHRWKLSPKSLRFYGNGKQLKPQSLNYQATPHLSYPHRSHHHRPSSVTLKPRGVRKPEKQAWRGSSHFRHEGKSIEGVCINFMSLPH